MRLVSWPVLPVGARACLAWLVRAWQKGVFSVVLSGVLATSALDLMEGMLHE